MSGYSFINPSRALLEMSLEALGGFAPVQHTTEVTTVPYELDTSWTQFEKELSIFKSKYAKVKRDLSVKMHELEEIKKSSIISRVISENVNSEELKERLLSVVDDYEDEQGATALAQHCGELKGECEAMKTVLENTGVERYAKFTCFICMDRLVDLFIDPCGHVVCGHCWANTRDKTKCPGCRAQALGAKKIFTM
jgi:rubrerythrin